MARAQNPRYQWLLRPIGSNTTFLAASGIKRTALIPTALYGIHRKKDNTTSVPNDLLNRRGQGVFFIAIYEYSHVRSCFEYFAAIVIRRNLSGISRQNRFAGFAEGAGRFPVPVARLATAVGCRYFRRQLKSIPEKKSLPLVMDKRNGRVTDGCQETRWRLCPSAVWLWCISPFPPVGNRKQPNVALRSSEY